MHARVRLLAALAAAALLVAPAAAFADPVVISKLKWSRRYARSGKNVVASYTASGSTTLSFAIVNAAGQAVRDLGDQVPIGPGQHAVDWDGYADTTLAVPDGEYRIVLSSSDPSGIAGKTVAPIWIDTIGPAIHFKTLHVKRSGQVVISVTDGVTGVNTATLLVDGRLVARSHAVQTRFAYRPRGGWARGRHTVTVLARDRTWNFNELTRTIVAR
jgi:hypothetical protein